MIGRPTKPLSSLTLVPNGPAISWPINVTALEVVSISTVESRLHHLQINLVWLRDGCWSVECSHTQAADASAVAHSFFRRTGCPGSAWSTSGHTAPMHLISSTLVPFSSLLLSQSLRQRHSTPSWSILLLVVGVEPKDLPVLLFLLVQAAWLPILSQNAAADLLRMRCGSW